LIKSTSARSVALDRQRKNDRILSGRGNHIKDRLHLNRAACERRPDTTPEKSRWLLLKRKENLKTDQRFRRRDLLR